jgi:DNA-binding HxlR family transcriptional regulator
MKEQIKNLIKTEGPKSFKQARKDLGLSGYHESKILDQTLRQMVKDKILFFKKSTQTYQLKDKREIIGTF